MRETLRAAFAYWIRLLDIESGVEGGDAEENIALGRGFLVSSPLVGSRIYEGDAFDGFVIYDDKRDGDASGLRITSVVTDGNQVNARDLEPHEVSLRTSVRTRGRPRGALNKRMAGCPSRRCHAKKLCMKCVGGKTTLCKPKIQKLRKKRTGGIYLSVDGNADSGRILELREVLAAESNLVKEASLRDLKRKFPGLELWVHDSVCACNFADSVVKHRLLDRFHIRNHKREVCRSRFNPNTPWNSKLRYKFGCANTVVCEQLFRMRNQYSAAQRMGRLCYRAFWMHFCMWYNSYVSGRRKGSLSLTRPATSRRDTLKRTGRR